MSSLTTKTSQKITATFINIAILAALMPFEVRSVVAQTTLACENVKINLLQLSNSAFVQYENSDRLSFRPGNSSANSTTDQYGIVTNAANTNTNPTSEANLPLRLVSLGIEDAEGNVISGLGAIALDLNQLYRLQGLSSELAQLASFSTIEQWADLLPETVSERVAAVIKEEVAAQMTDLASRNAVLELDDAELLTILGGFGDETLRSLGLPNNQIEILTTTELLPQSVGGLTSQIVATTQTATDQIDSSTTQGLLTAAQDRYQQELSNLREGRQIEIASGSKVNFRFRLDNQRNNVATIELADAATISKSGLTGTGEITAVTYQLVNNVENDDPKSEPQEVTKLTKVAIPSQSSLALNVEVEVGGASQEEVESIEIALQPDCGAPSAQAFNILPPIAAANGELIDPLGRITGCAGETLADYQGFSIALYDPDPSDPTGSSLQNLTPLTETELPDEADNDIPKGVEPNTQNSNPFFLVNSDAGQYSFLFDSDRQQLARGASYILLVSPPNNSDYDERRVKLEIGDRTGNIVEYTATSLDGKPIRATDGQTTITGEFVLVEDAERVGLELAVLDIASSVCDATEIQISKTGDRAAAEPGDIVLYRLAVSNLASAPIDNLEITDTLPAGFKLEPSSIKAETEETEVLVNVSQSGRTVDLSTDITLEPGATVNLIYAAQVTPNALRGSGRNSAIVNATRTDNNLSVQDGPAIHTLRLEPGIIEDAGTLIGRVFVDHNFDGEQQSGEPGIPNAVIYLEDGNRIITDPDGLFSVANVLPGIHTGILDLTTIPDYRLAPNVRFIERNSSSRLVQLEPGGLVRMNFGVTPTAAGKDTEPESRRNLPVKPQTVPQKLEPKTKPTISHPDI